MQISSDGKHLSIGLGKEVFMLTSQREKQLISKQSEHEHISISFSQDSRYFMTATPFTLFSYILNEQGKQSNFTKRIIFE